MKLILATVVLPSLERLLWFTPPPYEVAHVASSSSALPRRSRGHARPPLPAREESRRSNPSFVRPARRAHPPRRFRRLPRGSGRGCTGAVVHPAVAAARLCHPLLARRCLHPRECARLPALRWPARGTGGHGCVRGRLSP